MRAGAGGVHFFAAHTDFFEGGAGFFAADAAGDPFLKKRVGGGDGKGDFGCRRRDAGDGRHLVEDLLERQVFAAENVAAAWLPFRQCSHVCMSHLKHIHKVKPCVDVGRKFAVEKIDKRVPLVLGIGGNNTSELVLTIEGTVFKDIDAILSVCPYYNKPNQEGIYHHFRTLANASPVPIILYTVPGRTSSNITAATTLRLANDFSNIIGIKEASGNFDQIFQVLKNRPKDFLVISGDDGITLPLLAAGADGVISVIANAFPIQMSELVRFGLNGDFSMARKIHFQLIDLINALFVDGSPGGIKATLNLLHLCEDILRLPLVPVNKDVHKLIKKLIDQID